MSGMDRNIRQQLRKESDEMLFSKMELSDQVKQKIRQQAAGEKKGRRFMIPKAWAMGIAAAAAAVLLVVGIPLLQQDAGPAPEQQASSSLPPSDAGTVGSDQSSLITTPVSSVEDAKATYGPGLLVPTAVPEGYTLSKLETVGVQGEAVRDVIFTYESSGKTVTYAASRNPASFPADLFTKTDVGGVEGFVFEQPGPMTELFWMADGVQYSITGNVTADEAMKLAESVK